METTSPALVPTGFSQPAEWPKAWYWPIAHSNPPAVRNPRSHNGSLSDVVYEAVLQRR